MQSYQSPSTSPILNRTGIAAEAERDLSQGDPVRSAATLAVVMATAPSRRASFDPHRQASCLSASPGRRLLPNLVESWQSRDTLILRIPKHKLSGVGRPARIVQVFVLSTRVHGRQSRAGRCIGVDDR